MNRIILSVGAILAHALLNVIIISYVTNFDLTGSWIAVTGFLVLAFLLLVLFIKHLISFTNFIKSKTK